MEDPFANEASKHFEKFTKFATQFTKAFVPIVDTAIKSMEEPVSAFSVFQAAKESKKSKKQHKEKPVKEQNGHSQIQIGKAKPSKTNSKKPVAKKEVPASKSKQAKEAIPNNPAKNKKATNKSRTGKTKDAEVLNLVDQLLGTAPPKKLSKTEQKKKQELENYLAKQFERDEEDPEDDYDSEDDSQDYSDSDEFSDEYTINESGSFNEEYSQMEEEESNEDSEEAEEVLPITNKATRKRKSPEPDSVSKKKSIVAEPKKSKKIEEPTRKSLPNTKNEKVEESKRRKSLASLDDKGKQMRKVSVTSVDVKLEPLSPPHNVGKVSSIDEGKRAFQWLLNPVSVNDFFAKYWEAKACLIKRKQSNYFSHLISFEAIDEMLIKNHVEFTKNLDVTSYKNGKYHLIYLRKNTIIISLPFLGVRETLNPEGRALPPVVWDHYGQGCSIRLLNPQTFLPELFALNTTMQEYFHCLVGANAYLTPPNSQGRFFV